MTTLTPLQDLSAPPRAGGAALSAWQRVARSRPLAYLVFLALYIVPTVAIARVRLLWDDEFFTLYLANAGSWRELARALSTGADQHPPSFVWLTHLVLTTFGASNVTFRLTAIAGVALLCFCLYEIVGRLVDRDWGFCAMLLPLATPFYHYAFESRGYGLEVGFAAAAVLLWMLATAGRRRAVTLPLLAAALCGATGSHYYGALVAVPLAVGELTRTVARRRVDLPVWLAFAGAALPVLVFAPLLTGARSYSAHFWAPPRWGLALSWYRDAFGYVFVFPLALAAVAALRRGSESRPRAIRRWHGAAFLTMALLPPITVVFAKLVTHAFTSRYAIAALPGVCVLLTVGIARVSRPASWAPVAVWLATLLCFFAGAVRFYSEYRGEREELRETAALLRAAGDGPVVVSEPTSLHRLSFYARRDFASRVTYLADPRAAVRGQGFDTIDRGLLDLNPWFPLNVHRLDEWVASHPSFVMWGYTGEWGWQHAEFAARGADLRVREVRGQNLLFSVKDARPGTEPPRPGDPSGYPRLFDRMPSEGEPLCRKYLSAESCPAID